MAAQFIRTDNQAKRIVSIRFMREQDECPDLSFLGEYSDSPEEAHIDREERGDKGRGEYRYFNLGTGDAEYMEQDYARMESYNRGDWWMTFCQAVAVISINGIQQRVTSGGLGGVESDSEESYFDEIRGEQFAELADVLADMGFSKRAVNKAVKDAK